MLGRKVQARPTRGAQLWLGSVGERCELVVGSRTPVSPVTGSVELDARSIQSLDPRQSAADAAAAPARKQASNWLITAHQRSATGNTLAVMGPQLGYYFIADRDLDLRAGVFADTPH